MSNVAAKIHWFVRNSEPLEGVNLPSVKEAASVLAFNRHQMVVNHSNPSIISQAQYQPGCHLLK